MFVSVNFYCNWTVNYRYLIKQTSVVFWLLFLIVVLVMLTPSSGKAEAYSMPEEGSRLIGSEEIYIVNQGDYFHLIAQYYNIGVIALMQANPGIDPFLPPTGTKLQIPQQMLLPDVPHRGIVVNLPELRLYYFTKETNMVHVFPVGIGRIGRETPIMHSKIMSKIKDPSWTPSNKIREEYFAKHGKELARSFPPGEDNPLGAYALQLEYGANDYLIHGTNQNFGIGMRVSSGCIRMNPDNIAWLFEQVDSGVAVRVIDQPIKLANEPNGVNILEVHSPLSTLEEKQQYKVISAEEGIVFANSKTVNFNKVKDVLRLHQGLPVNVSY